MKNPLKTTTPRPTQNKKNTEKINLESEFEFVCLISVKTYIYKKQYLLMTKTVNNMNK